MSEQGNTVPTGDYTQPNAVSDTERRFYPRLETQQSAYLWVETEEGMVRTCFKTINVSKTGVMLNTAEYEIKPGHYYEMALIIETGNLARIYQLDALCVHSKNGKSGFRMQVRWHGQGRTSES